jgi:hypothetical protein
MKTIKQEAGEQRTQLSIWLDAILFKKLANYAAKLQITKREVVVRALQMFFGKEK